MTNSTTDEEVQTCEIVIQDLEEGIKEQRKAILGVDVEEEELKNTQT